MTQQEFPATLRDGRLHFPTIAAAEGAIAAAGYVRDQQRHVWVNGNKTAKVVRTNNLEFIVEWG